MRVNLDVYDRHEEVLAKLQARNTDYDIVCPSTYTIQVNWVEVGVGAQQYQLVFQQPAF